MKVKSLLISQPKPSNENSPYLELEKKYKVTIDFEPFVQIRGVQAKELRLQKIDLSNFSVVVLTSRNAIDNYFRLAEEMRFNVPDSMKYFCQSEAIAYYLQRYIVYRKRKIYVGGKDPEDMLPLFEKNINEKYLVPSSDIINPDLIECLNKSKIDWTRAIMFKTVSIDIKKNVKDISNYDILVFFSPLGISSLFENFPNFKQNGAKIAAFGTTTIQAAQEAGLEVNIPTPTKDCPSMTMALDRFIANINK